MEKEAKTSVFLTVTDSEAMEHLGGIVARLLSPGDMVYLIGDLGAGKTTFVRGAARQLGYTGRVTSPTFTLMNQYCSEPPLVHLDFYRLESGAMMEDLGLDDYIHRDAILLIEWPQIGMEALPEPTLEIEINLTEEDYDLPRQVQLRIPKEKKEMIERLQAYAHTCH